MPIAIPTFIEKEPVVRPDLLAETPDPKTDVTAAEWNEVTALIVEIAETLNAGGTATPSDADPEDVTNAVADPGVGADYARIDHVHQLGTLTGTDFADPVLTTASPDQGGLGVSLTPSGMTGPVDIGIGPTIPAAGDGKALVLTAGVGAVNQDGGTLTLDAGPSNGGGSVGGNVKVGRDNAAEVLIGLEGVGSPITLEGTTTLLGHTPTAAAHAATKAYVDAVAQGLSAKMSVRLATTVAGTLASSFENGDTIDGVVLATGNRLLIKNQAAPAENGIYVVAASGAPTRATDFDTAAEVEAGAFVFVEEGTANGDSGWVLTTDGTIIIGTTALAWVQFSGAGQITAGTGLTKTGNTLGIDFGEVGDIVAIGAANAAGVLDEAARADHAHSHGAQTDGTHHAVVTDAANGFLAATDFDAAIGKCKNRKTVFRETFEGGIGPHVAFEATGTAASAGVAVGGGYLGFGRFQTGSTATGMARVRTANNWIYNGAVGQLIGDVVGNDLQLSALGTQEHDLHAVYCGAISGNGFSITYRRSVSANWQLAKWTAGVPAFTDTGIAVDTNSHRFGCIYDRAAATAALYIDGTLRGTLTSVPTFSAEYFVALQITKTLGTTAHEAYCEFAKLDAVYTTARPG